MKSNFSLSTSMRCKKRHCFSFRAHVHCENNITELKPLQNPNTHLEGHDDLLQRERHHVQY